MNEHLANSQHRGLLVAASFLIAGLLSYLSIRNALAIHFADLQTAAGLERATELEPRDARNWYLLGRYWQYNLENPDTPKAIRAYQASLAVNPASADTWLDLAMAYESEDKIPAARDAFLHARKAYPLSAEGAWRYGNFLLRQGQLHPAFLEIRHSVEVDPNRGAEAFSRSLRADPDVDEILNEVLPPVSRVYVDVIRDQASDGKTDIAFKVWERLASLHPRLSLQDVFVFVDILKQKKQIQDASRVWDQAVGFAGFSDLQGPAGSVLWDGGFESGITGGGFSWRIPANSPALQFRLDTQEKHSGKQSLRVIFTGKSNVTFMDLCHYVPVQPDTNYEFSAWARTKALTTDQGVRFRLQPVGDENASAALTSEIHGTQPWTLLKKSWTSGKDTQQVQVCLTRLPSNVGDDKVQGTVWIDDVALVPAPAERSQP